MVDQTIIQNFEEIAQQLTDIKLDVEQYVNKGAWDAASLYIKSYDIMAKALKEKGVKVTVRNINKHLSAVEGYKGYSDKWLRSVKRTGDIFPDLFEKPNKRKVSFSAYKIIANCSVKDKQAIREWADRNRATVNQVRDRISKIKNPERPDFEHKVSNHWHFAASTGSKDFDGGIHPAVVANLVHYYTNPDDIIVDPMAGSGTTLQALNMYEYFQRKHPAQPYSGVRTVLMSDISPLNSNIIQADATKEIPFADNSAKLVILDPPYWKIAEGKYKDIGETIEEWRKNLRCIMLNSSRVISDDGYIAVVIDDYLRLDTFEPLATYVAMLGLEIGLSLDMTIYNSYPNFVVTMNGAAMQRAKDARLPVSSMKIIHVFKVEKD